MLTFLALVVLVTGAPQSLGELAKTTAAAREKAKADGKPAPKVWTDADLKALESTLPPPIPITVPVKDTPATAELQATAAEAKKDEPYWRSRFSPLWTQLDNDTAQLVAANTRVNTYRAALEERQRAGYLYTDPLIKQQYLDALTEASRLEAAVAADRQQLSDLEEDARRANVPPGWYRRR